MGYYDDCYEPSVIEGLLDEFKEKAKELLKKEVQDNCTRLSYVEGDLKKLRETLTKREQELETREREFNKREKSAKDLMAAELATMLTGFKKGDQVWYIETKTEKLPCPVCGGNHETKTEQDDVIITTKCKKCYYGKIDKHEYSIKSGQISDMKLNINLTGGNKEYGWKEAEISYGDHSYDNYNYVASCYVGYDNKRCDNLFKTEQEATEAMEKLRGKQ